MTNQTNGGVWVACSEWLPERHHADNRLDVVYKMVVRDGQLDLFVSDFRSAPSFDYWLDTTIPIVTVAEHEAEVAALKKQIEALNATVARLNETIREFNESW